MVTVARRVSSQLDLNETWLFIPVEKGETYRGSLVSWDGGDPVPLTTFMTDVLKQMFSLYEKELR